MSVAKAAIIGSGNIGTDLMFKIRRLSEHLKVAAMVGIDEDSDGLLRARRLGIATTAHGVAGLLEMSDFDDVDVVFDATSAGAHRENARLLAPYGKSVVDLTPAAVGPFVVPAVNLETHLNELNVNMVTCGGQATIPVVAAVAASTPVLYAEIVASIASRSAGPGTRANIDEFTETTARALEVVGGAKRARAIIVLNPAEPPLIMRDTVHCLIGDADLDGVERNVTAIVESVAGYVPGYRLKQSVQFRRRDADDLVAGLVPDGHGHPCWQVSIYLEVEGAAHYLPGYAGNLDIMTSAALRVGESLVSRQGDRVS